MLSVHLLLLSGSLHKLHLDKLLLLGNFGGSACGSALEEGDLGSRCLPQKKPLTGKDN